MTYEPSPSASNVPVQNGSPWHVMSAGDGYGPQSSTCTVAVSRPSPETTAVSVISLPGVDSWALIWVRIAGVPRTTVVSVASPHGVSTPVTVSLSAIDSRYV